MLAREHVTLVHVSFAFLPRESSGAETQIVIHQVNAVATVDAGHRKAFFVVVLADVGFSQRLLRRGTDTSEQEVAASNRLAPAGST
jgi:hypothetical protein